ncbi:hypothetical protein PPERSA_01997 [Pseudocohnilembus persalinus]|uniref:JmjC domain-containing protein n=1 Tax=Pseudocohnilembus persalinus TaxID=266149 RepID=A0A0V0QF32_PSEPJ|nr:hypothetical protein PPERSA_01997 [Pseudocohnilembus persalinus]|eukprot:KRX00818.1 hypothetical protein PPERSA_01997 [Pseudocohnilembus persalinus]
MIEKKISDIQKFNPNHILSQLNQYTSIIFRDGINNYAINTDIFDRKNLAKKHGNQIIDYRIQNSEAYGFESQSNKLYQGSFQAPLSEYISYQDHYLENPKDTTFLKNWINRKIKDQKQLKKINKQIEDNYHLVVFAVNIDTYVDKSWQDEIQEFYLGIDKFLKPCSEYDVLSYCRQHSLGITSPQIYLKVPGVWTGGHQENCGVRAININLGPGESEWYTVDYEEANKFRKIVKKEKNNFDIHLNEGLWYADEQYLQKKNITYKKTIQKKGDIVVLGPGVLHWVRSIGKKPSVQIAYNYMYRHPSDEHNQICKDSKQIKYYFKYQFMEIERLYNKIENFLETNDISNHQELLEFCYQDKYIGETFHTHQQLRIIPEQILMNQPKEQKLQQQIKEVKEIKQNIELSEKIKIEGNSQEESNEQLQKPNNNEPKTSKQNKKNNNMIIIKKESNDVSQECEFEERLQTQKKQKMNNGEGRKSHQQSETQKKSYNKTDKKTKKTNKNKFSSVISINSDDTDEYYNPINSNDSDQSDYQPSVKMQSFNQAKTNKKQRKNNHYTQEEVQILEEEEQKKQQNLNQKQNSSQTQKKQSTLNKRKNSQNSSKSSQKAQKQLQDKEKNKQENKNHKEQNIRQENDLLESQIEVLQSSQNGEIPVQKVKNQIEEEEEEEEKQKEDSLEKPLLQQQITDKNQKNNLNDTQKEDNIQKVIQIEIEKNETNQNMYKKDKSQEKEIHSQKSEKSEIVKQQDIQKNGKKQESEQKQIPAERQGEIKNEQQKQQKQNEKEQQDEQENQKDQRKQKEQEKNQKINNNKHKNSYINNKHSRIGSEESQLNQNSILSEYGAKTRHQQKELQKQSIKKSEESIINEEQIKKENEICEFNSIREKDVFPLNLSKQQNKELTFKKLQQNKEPEKEQEQQLQQQ